MNPDIEEIKKRCEAATPEPLTIHRYDHGGGRVIQEFPQGRNLIADFYNEADREFYVNARKDIPVLLSALETAQNDRDHNADLAIELRQKFEDEKERADKIEANLEVAQKEIANRAHFESEYLKQIEASRREAEASLTFDRFREANVTRCVKWHPLGIGSWSASDWITAVVGELGELAGLIKMRNRERDGLPGNKFSPTQKQIADELADVLTYLDLLAAMLGVDLGRAAAQKFNEVSERVGFPDRIDIPQALARTEKEAHGKS